MLGGLIMIVVLAVFPAMVIMGSVAVAVALSKLLTDDAEARNPGSEFIELNR